MILRNTTDIPRRLIQLAVQLGIQDGVEIDEIVVKNKRNGKIGGQWGWYYSRDRKVVLIVPREIQRIIVGVPFGFTTTLKYTRGKICLKSRAEFVVAVMAHELRHAWQFQVEKKWTGQTQADVWVREIDAEKYEIEILNKFRKMCEAANELQMAASVG